MAEFLIELYASKTNCAATADGWERLGRSATELTAEGRPVRLVRSIFVPEDETCFVLVETATAANVHETVRRAGLVCERVVEAAIDLTESLTAPPGQSREGDS